MRACVYLGLYVCLVGDGMCVHQAALSTALNPTQHPIYILNVAKFHDDKTRQNKTKEANLNRPLHNFQLGQHCGHDDVVFGEVFVH